MGDGLPRDERRLRVCAWCGGPIEQPTIGRLRDYCRRTHRELAYRERVTQRRIDEALAAVLAASDSSVHASWFGAGPGIIGDETRSGHDETGTDTE